MNHRLILLISIVMSICASSSAQSLSDSVLINFRQSKINLDTAYMDNPGALQHARQMIDYYHRPDSNFVLTNVTVIGGASPEGSVRFNEWLSRKRAGRIFDYIGQHFELPDSLTTFVFLGRDWIGLRRMVLDDPEVPFRDDVLSTLDKIVESYSGGEKESHDNLNRIKRLHGGVPYIYMYHKLFPTLRASKLVLTFGHPRPPLAALSGILPPPMLSTKVARQAPDARLAAPQPALWRPFYMDIRTNMLYDVLAVPNIGAEFYLGRDLSIVGNWMYAWWKTDRRHRYWRTYGGDLALRWWFGEKARLKPLTGHHLGVYGGLLTYDFEWGGKGYMGGVPGGSLWDKCNWFAGVEYGYSLPVTRRLNIDFTIGIGYLQGEYRVYDPVDNCYVWKETRMCRRFGPTKAEVSLVWLIGRGNYNKEKGGCK